MYRKLRNDELHRLSTEEFKKAPKLQLAVVLDNIRSSHNIGSAFRSADSFLVEKIFLCGICATPPNPEIHKSALGAEFSVEWEYFKETAEAVSLLRAQGYRIVGIEQAENSVRLQDIDAKPGEKYALIFGNEVNGVQQEVVDMCHQVVEIPQYGTKHSLNVSLAVGVVLWEYSKRLKI